MLVTDTAAVRDLAVDNAALYWTREDGIKKLSLAGGDPAQLVSGQTETQHLAIDATSVYFTDGGTYPNYDGSVMRVALDGSGLTTLVDRLLGPFDIAVDSTSVYWTSANGVFRTSLAGGNFDVLVFDVSAGPLAVDANAVYYVDYTNNAIDRVPLAGGAPTQLTSGIAGALAVTDASLFWTVPFTPGATDRLDLGRTSPVPIAMEQGDNLSKAIAVDGEHVYWTTTRPLERADLDGSHRVQLSAYEPDADAIALDGTHIYWANGNAEIKVISPR